MPAGSYRLFDHTADVGVEASARSQRGAFAKNWWATRWIEALERLVDAGRLTRGRSYARRGQVLSIEETKGGIQARVQGSRPKPYKISIQVAPLTDAQWERVAPLLPKPRSGTPKGGRPAHDTREVLDAVERVEVAERHLDESRRRRTERAPVLLIAGCQRQAGVVDLKAISPMCGETINAQKRQVNFSITSDQSARPDEHRYVIELLAHPFQHPDHQLQI